MLSSESDFSICAVKQLEHHLQTLGIQPSHSKWVFLCSGVRKWAFMLGMWRTGSYSTTLQEARLHQKVCSEIEREKNKKCSMLASYMLATKKVGTKIHSQTTRSFLIVLSSINTRTKRGNNIPKMEKL
jgi:hypothetical protein